MRAKKSAVCAILAASFSFVLTACGMSTIYYGDLPIGGLDFSKTNCKEVVLTAYHTDENDHIWVPFGTCTYVPEDGHAVLADAEVKDGVLKVTFTDNYDVSEVPDRMDIATEEIGRATMDVPDDTPDIQGFKSYKVKNRKGEQLWTLWSANYGGGVIFAAAEPSLDKPYDTDGDTIADILVTVTLVK